MDTQLTGRYLGAMGRRKSGWERIVGGFAALVVFAVVWKLNLLPPAIPIVAGIIFGLAPVLGGTRRIVRDYTELRQERRLALEAQADRERQTRDSLEKTILRIAQERGGVVTPALVVLGSDLKLQEAEKALGDMAARGYAEMRIKDNGTIDYVFHDLKSGGQP